MNRPSVGPASRLTYAACAIMLAVAPIARAVVYRDDMSDALSRGLSNQAQFRATGKVNGTAGTGTLIAPDWVLTAKQITGTTGTGSFTIGGVTYSGQVYANPANDLSLVHLTSGSVPATAAMPIAPGFFGGDAGKVVWLAGYGRYGTILSTGNTPPDGNLRAGTNVVRELAGPYLYTDNANTAATSSAYESNAAPADTGGPMYRQVNNTWYVVGAASGLASGGYVHTPTAPSQSFILDTIRAVSGNASFSFATPTGPTALLWHADPTVTSYSDGPGVWDVQRPNFWAKSYGTFQYDNGMNNDVTFGSGGGNAGVVMIAPTNLTSGTPIAGGNGPAVTAGGVSAHSVTFNASSGGTYTLASTGAAALTLTNNGSTDPTINALTGGTIAAPIASSAATITKLGAGTLTFAGTNTYTGRMIVSAGTLAARFPAALPGYATANRLTVASGAGLTLGVGGTGGWTAPQVGSLLATPALAAGSTLGFDTTGGDFTYATPITGNIGLTKTASNTLTLTAANTYTGVTTIVGGTLALSGAGRLPPSSALVFTDSFANVSRLLIGAGVDQTVSSVSVLEQAGQAVISGPGSVTLTGTTLGNGSNSAVNMSYLGGFTFNQPTVALNVNGDRTQTLLPNNTTITASALNVGTGSYGTATNTSTSFSFTGNTNVNADAIRIGNLRASGSVLTNNYHWTDTQTIRLRGTDGSGRVGSMVVGFNTAGNQSQSGSFSTADATLDARVGSLVVGDYQPDYASSSTYGVYGMFTMNGGTLDVTALTLGHARVNYANYPGGSAEGVFNQSAGLVKVGTLTLGLLGRPDQGRTTVKATYNLGTSADSGTLAARSIAAGPVMIYTADTSVSRAINFVNGRITTYDATGDLTITGMPSGTSNGAANKTIDIVLAANGTHALTAPAGRTITLTDSVRVSGSGTLTIDGAGTVSVNGSNTYKGGTTVVAGTLRVDFPSRTPLLSGNGTNLQNGRIVFAYATATDNPLAAIRSLLAAGRSGNFTTGVLRSTTATAARGLGYADDGTAVTVMATLYGDADLDGGVSINDFNALAANFGQSSGRAWTQGDFDYDGGVSINDFNLLAGGFGQMLPASGKMWAGLLAFAAAHDDLVAFEAVTGVPEPAGLGILVACTGFGLRRRRGT